ncbi:C4-dicarboxylate TRAP transporter substrate-binding protein [bacterium]|nr:C4-dicarboxylate TRAP transporter substrate-binding protein [bacterium]
MMTKKGLRQMTFFLIMVLSFCTWVQADQKPIVLRSLIQSPAKIKYSKSFDAYLDAVEQRTNGRVKFERYYSGALAKAPQILDAVGGGIADIAVFVATYAPGKVPLATVGYLPGAYDHVWVAAKAYLELYETYPPMQQEMKRNNVRLVSAWGTGPYFIFTKQKVTSLEDMQGLKIAATGQIGLLVKALGGSAVGLPITESYTALERGTIDGVGYGPSAAAGYSIHEVAKNLFRIRVGGGVGPIIFNLDKWEKLPADIQTIMLEVGQAHPQSVEQIYQIDGDQASLEKMKKAGLQVTDPTPEMAARVQKIITDSVWTKWAADLDKKGQPGTEVLNMYLDLLKKYEPLSPF